MLPLLRLNVSYADENQVFNAIRFGQRYIERVANPKEIVKLKSGIKRTINKKNKDDEDFLTNVGFFFVCKIRWVFLIYYILLLFRVILIFQVE